MDRIEEEIRNPENQDVGEKQKNISKSLISSFLPITYKPRLLIRWDIESAGVLHCFEVCQSAALQHIVIQDFLAVHKALSHKICILVRLKNMLSSVQRSL